MKKTFRNITGIALSLALAVCVVLTSTSCLYTLEVLTDSGYNEPQDENKDNGGTSAGGTSAGTDGSTDSVTEDGVQFCPGTNDPDDIDGLNPESRAMLSTVSIVAKLDILSAYPSYGSGTTTEYTSYGSGIIYQLDREAGDAYIITNFHVVYNKDEVGKGGFSDSLSLFLYGMESEQYAIPAKVVGGSMTYDIAVLKVEGSEVLKNSMACAVILGNSEDVRIHDDVFAVGNPEGYGISITDGIVSVESETLQMLGADGRTSIALRVMRVSAAINDGNSGGGLYSADGRLMGIVNAKRTGSDVDNIGYAIPINLARNLADNIIKNCDGGENLSLKKCLIGITLTPATSGLASDGKGGLIIKEQIVIHEIAEGCITDKVQVGDIINSITIDGVKTEVTRNHHVIDAMLKAGVGSTVTLSLTRGTSKVDVTIVIPEEALTTVK